MRVLYPFSEYSSKLPSYLAALHNLIYTYNEKLAEVTSRKVANTFLGIASDKLMLDLHVTHSEHAVDTIREHIQEWGLKLETTEAGRHTSCEIECPFAPLVHPLIARKNPFCPVSLLLLGAKRLSDRDASIASMTLEENGCRFTIGPTAALQ